MSADIFVIDDQSPEDLAMLQALYSRSPASVMQHLDKLKTSGSGNFMERYYVGYGHASIGDCGATTIFVEQVSMMVAKAIQDNPLYSGQEASTRYLDYSKQAIIDPYNTPASAAIQQKWMAIYNRTLEQLIEALKQARPFNPAEYKNETIWQNAIKARAFDIARALLPLGTTTLLSWSTNLRQARDHLRRLKHHPLPEMQDVAKRIFTELKAKYTHSFRGDEMTSSDSRDAYADKYAIDNAFNRPEVLQNRFGLTANEMSSIKNGDMVVRRDAIDLDGLRNNEASVLSERPNGANLPWRLNAYGCYNLFCLIDFGSYRDLQRHRNGVCTNPVVDARFGLNPWYEQQFATLLGANNWKQLQDDISSQIDAIATLKQQEINTSPLLDQYFYPMGMQVLVHAAYTIPQVVYVGELRSGKTVHGSLRPVAQAMLRVLQNDLPGIAIHGDFDVDDWSAKRGEQTIAEKATAA